MQFLYPSTALQAAHVRAHIFGLRAQILSDLDQFRRSSIRGKHRHVDKGYGWTPGNESFGYLDSSGEIVF